MHFRAELGNGPALSLRRPGAGPPFPAAPLRGGLPVDYGPRVDDLRYNVQVAARLHQQPPSPKSSQGVDDQEEAPPSRHLWVGNVSQEVTEGLLVERFSKFGLIESVTVYSQRNYAFINFRHLDNAKDAKDGLQGVALGGLAMRIEFAKGAKPSRHLWVGGIGQRVSREQIEEEFKRFGMMEDFKFLRDRNCAFVDFVKIEDAIAAVDSLNRARIGDEELRVDFGRSQPPKREVSNRPGTATPREEWGGPHAKNGQDHSDQFSVPADLSRGPPDEVRQSERGSCSDSFCGPSDASQTIAGSGTTGQTPGRTRVEKEEPSDVLWVGFPLLSKVDEEGLRRAFVPYGEVERVKTFPGRTYAFVQFKNVMEATHAKDALEGKLFNDPRVHIRFSNSEIGPVDNARTDGILSSPSRGREAPGYSEKAIGRSATSDRIHSIISPLHPTGLRPEYYPGGLARGAALARAVGTLPGIGSGHGVGRGLGSGGLSERIVMDQNDSRSGKGLPLPAARPGGRSPYDEQWDLPEEEIMAREPKRPRLLHGGSPDSVYNNSSFGERRYSDSDKVVPGPNPGRQEYGLPHSVWKSGGGDEYKKGTGIPRVRLESVQFDGPRHAPAGQGYTRSLTTLGPGLTGGFTSVVKRDGSDTNSGVTGINEGWRWHGTIAKGGTPVCRARCLPVGKGIDVTVPDVVNCTARTDLDMLAKHVYQAGDFGVVFFVPEADPDVPPYHDFMHYLGEKHRAGVAKLGDGTTLFLVPPSEFSERVLKVPGKNCLFGVVLTSQPHSSIGHAQHQQHPPPPPPPPPPQQQHYLPQQRVHLLQQQLLAHQQQYSQPQGLAFGNGNSIHAKGAIPGPYPPQAQAQPAALTATSSTLIPSQLTTLASGLPTVLTPELIVSLTALLPHHNHTTVFPSLPLSGSTILPPTSRDGMTGGHIMGRGAPNLVSTTPAPSTVNDRLICRQPQISQQSILHPEQWAPVLSDQQSGGSGHTSAPPDHGSAPPSQQPQGPHASMMQQPLPGLPSVQSQQVYLAAHSQEVGGPGYGGQQLPQHPRPPQYPASQLGGAPLLPSDQLAQLTALLTQRQHQPAQQQHAAQLLQQHYQQQQPPVHVLSQQHQQPPPLPYYQSQAQRYHQQTQPPSQHVPQSTSQQQWTQGGPLLQQHPGHSQVPNGDDCGGWDGPLVPQVQQQQSYHQPQTLSPTLQQLQNPLAQQQLQQPRPTGGVNVEQAGSMSQDDAERQKRFQATLQLAAALLQQMQHQQTPRQGTADQL